MEFLKQFFGDKSISYDEFVNAINAYNGNEANKEKLIKLVNLTEGGYVSKDKYTSLETDLSGKASELEKANGLIEELKKGSKGNEGLQEKLNAYESEVNELREQNKQLKVESAIKVALLSAKASDIDYMTFKLKEKGELELAEDGSIKGIDDMISGLKTQFPNQFEKDGINIYEPNKLPITDNREKEPSSLSEALQMSFESKEQ